MFAVFRGRSRLLFLVLTGALVLGAAAAVAAYVMVKKDPGDISNPGVDFIAPPPEKAKPKAGKVVDRSAEFHWPQYGFTKAHRRVYMPRNEIRGPYRNVWRHRAPALLEFAPVIYRGRIYQLAGNGLLYALDKRTGKLRWKRKLGTLAASSPAVAGASIYVTLLESRGHRSGRIAALRVRDGSVRWVRNLRSRSESSPLLHRGRLYFGTEDGTVLGLNAHNGRTVWRYRAPGAVKGSPTLSGRTLYFGDYAGNVHAVRRSDGKPIWRVAPAKRFLGGGRFYATAAVAFGRVYIGSTDGRQYSLSARNGKLAWARQTGRYVYSSAAVQNVAGLGPTVFFGSYDGHLYAVDARSGRTRWKFRSGGKISGPPTIVGDTVYFSDLGKHRTYGLKTRTGRVVFRRGFGAFDPVVSDGRHLYLTGYSSLTALLPRSDPEGRERAKAERRRYAAKKRRKAAKHKAERRRAARRKKARSR